jgi:diaminopimelate decarboxylase
MANNYNGVPRAPVVFAGGGQARTVVRRETFEDLHHRDVSPAADRRAERRSEAS